MSRARWAEYARLLDAARSAGYEIISLEDWLLDAGGNGERLLLLRHDVDQHPRSALRMAAIEERQGLRSTWYFRWRTAHLGVIASLRQAGHSVGLHYETLSRVVLERRVSAPESGAVVDECRAMLRAEIAAFAALHGPARSVCPHGDSRVPHVRNAVLLQGQDRTQYGIEIDGNEGIRGRRLGHWLTDRSRAEGGWVDAVDPLQLLSDGVSPILCITHPNNWTSGPDLWVDRLLRRALPSYGSFARRPIRTGADAPPLASS